MAKHPKYQVFTGSNGKHYFRLTAKNGQAILQSQGYADKAGCKKGIDSVRKNCGSDDRYDRKTATNGQFFFNLVAGNRQTIGTSEMYTTEAARENGIKSVKTNGPVAEVEEGA